MKTSLRLFIFWSLFLPLASFAEKPLALVWNGPGVCEIGCAPAAAKVARRAGFRTQYVHPGNLDSVSLDQASVWVQPGGKSSIAARAMGPAFMERIRSFVANGGGYVGYCAGMFIATEEIASRGEAGLGILPGRTQLLLKHDPPLKYVKVNLQGRWRRVYYAGGPFLRLSAEEASHSGARVLARYSTGEIAALESRYGHGKVLVAGFHPEAAWIWGLPRFRFDLDGSERYFAIQMMKKAAR